MPDLYYVKGEAGNVGTPGAPILNFGLVVAAGTGKVSGHVSIVQGGVQSPSGPIEVSVTGNIHQLGVGPARQVVSLEGTYLVPFGPPPLIGSMVETFKSVFSVDHAWNGHGSFSYGGHAVDNVPVRKTGP
jgi:hypothetical protein